FRRHPPRHHATTVVGRRPTRLLTLGYPFSLVDPESRRVADQRGSVQCLGPRRRFLVLASLKTRAETCSASRRPTAPAQTRPGGGLRVRGRIPSRALGPALTQLLKHESSSVLVLGLAVVIAKWH